MLNVSAQSAACGDAVVLRPGTGVRSIEVSEVLSVDPVRKLRLMTTPEAEKIDQEHTSDSAYFSSVGLLLASQEQNWETNIELGDKGSKMMLQLPYFVGY